MRYEHVCSVQKHDPKEETQECVIGTPPRRNDGTNKPNIEAAIMTQAAPEQRVQ
jgi:hypothetical protein